VNYVDDLSDPAKKATLPAPTPVAPNFIGAFKPNLMQADIVAVNGKPARGLFVLQFGPRVVATTQLTPGQSIADLGGGCQLQASFVILRQDGTPVGTLMATGTTAMGPPPGAPGSAAVYNMVIVGGTGAYLGAHGQTSRGPASGVRTASMAEDPAYRRVNGGGRQRFLIHLTQAMLPLVVPTPAGPAIFHEDMSPVSAASPARPGEWLTMGVANLGPTRPAVDPGMPFPEWEPGKELLVMAPVEVTVGGREAEVRNTIGWPGQVNVYRVDFRVPEGMPSDTVGVFVISAWLRGFPVPIVVR
jgi:hypothetical protein